MQTRLSLTLASFLVLLPAGGVRAEKPTERPVLSLSGATFRPLPLALTAPVGAGPAAARAAGQELSQVLEQDLAVSGLFDLLDPKSFLADPSEGLDAARIRFGRWQDVGAEALVKASIADTDPVTVDLRLYNVVAGREEFALKRTVPAAEVRRLGHAFADELFRFYTREPGSFRTRLASVRKLKGLKQIFVSDWDGRDPVALTQTSLNLLPAWYPDGEHLAFTSYRTGNPDLYRLGIRAGAVPEMLVRRPSRLVSGATLSRDGRKLAFAMSEDDGNSHLWIAAPDGSNPRRLTDGFGLNTSPSFSPDGKQLAFVSNRAGSPQIYILPAEGGTPKRLTFQGTYNQTPDWSPRGDLIAFTARDERNVFDLFTVDPATSKIARLTQGQGNNEEPSFSPNGRLIAFTSTRAGNVSQLFVMSADGAFQRQMTRGPEAVFTPAWGPAVP